MGQAQEWLDEAVRRHESETWTKRRHCTSAFCASTPDMPGRFIIWESWNSPRANTAAGAELLRAGGGETTGCGGRAQSLGVAYKRLVNGETPPRPFERALAIDPAHARRSSSWPTCRRRSVAATRRSTFSAQRSISIRRTPKPSGGWENCSSPAGTGVGAENCFARVVDTGPPEPRHQCLGRADEQAGHRPGPAGKTRSGRPRSTGEFSASFPGWQRSIRTWRSFTSVRGGSKKRWPQVCGLSSLAPLCRRTQQSGGRLSRRPPARRRVAVFSHAQQKSVRTLPWHSSTWGRST